MLLGGHAGLGQVALLRLGQLALGDILEAQLDSLITVFLGGLLLHHDTGTGFDNGNRDHLAVGVENLAHADFLTDDSFLHGNFSFYKVIGRRSWLIDHCCGDMTPSASRKSADRWVTKLMCGARCRSSQ